MMMMCPSLQQVAMPSYQVRKNSCCITNENQKQQRRRHAPLRARDRVIDFGKYKGKMLGSLPSSYLKWVSKNLRARDFEEWAILADQVLVDPIYRDRIEWEFALDVLDGKSARSTEPADSRLQELSERFGWDYLDKNGWSKVNFDLLGTSRGGRIPRRDNPDATQPNLPPRRDNPDAAQPNLPPPTPANRPPTSITNIPPANTSKRMERREKLKMRLRNKHESQQHKDDTVSADVQKPANPFPGRQALLRKAINHRAQS